MPIKKKGEETRPATSRKLGDRIIAGSFIALILLGNILLHADEQMFKTLGIFAQLAFAGLFCGLVLKLVSYFR